MSEDGKKNWREIDQARNRGIKFEKQSSKAEARAQHLASKAAKVELENLFRSSPLSKEKSALLKEINTLRGKAGYYEKLTDYYNRFGLPAEWEAQSLFLDHKDKTLVGSVLDSLVKTAPRENLAQQDLLAAKLRVMAVSTFDSTILEKIKKLEEALLRKT